MTYTGMFLAKQGIMVFVLSVLKRIYICLQVCPYYKRGTAGTIDLICLMKFVCTPSIKMQAL